MQGLNRMLQQAAVPQPQQQMQLSTPFNDMQLVAMMAAQFPVDMPPKEAVSRGIAILAEVIVRLNDELPGMIAFLKSDFKQ